VVDEDHASSKMRGGRDAGHVKGMYEERRGFLPRGTEIPYTGGKATATEERGTWEGR